MLIVLTLKVMENSSPAIMSLGRGSRIVIIGEAAKAGLVNITKNNIVINNTILFYPVSYTHLTLPTKRIV